MRSAAAAFVALAASVAAAQSPPPGVFKGKVKEGLYETTVHTDMGDMPNVPADQKKTSSKIDNCVTAADIEKGFTPSGQCQIRDFKMQGNTATWTEACKGRGEKLGEHTMKFAGNSFTSDAKITLKSEAGQVAHITQRMESRLKGACPKAPPKDAKPADPPRK
jgi:uncharacterized protein DUF3617